MTWKRRRRRSMFLRLIRSVVACATSYTPPPIRGSPRRAPPTYGVLGCPRSPLDERARGRFEKRGHMTGRFSALSLLALLIVLPSQSSTMVAGQQSTINRAYSVPRTPWGDPNLQGNFTNKYEQNTPFERPPEFEGRRVDDVTGAELASVLAKREQQVLERPLGVGPYQFRDNLEVTKASQAWFVIDPPDGRIPPLTAEARERMASDLLNSVSARQRRSSFGDGPFNGPED